jgi:hypothetical protein
MDETQELELFARQHIAMPQTVRLPQQH